MKTPIDIDEEYKNKIEEECFSGDWEFDHMTADDILVELLRKSGYINTANAYRKVGKWYS